MQKFLRIIAGIAGGLAIVFGVRQILDVGAFPGCDDADIQRTVRSLAIQNAPASFTGNGNPNSEAWRAALAALNVSGITEISWDSDGERRQCAAIFDLKLGTSTVYDSTKMGYSISRSATDSNALQVVLQPAR